MNLRPLSLHPGPPRLPSHIPRARSIARTLGTFYAARYLAARGWSVDAALYILTHR